VSRMGSQQTARSLDTGRSAAGNPALDELVAAVRAARPRLVDAWEATALIESLGYTDARVQQEFGFSDTRAAGEYVYPLCRGRLGPGDRWAPTVEPAATIFMRAAASTLIYALPWLAVFLVQIAHPEVMRAPTRVAPVLALALMFSLVVSGGFVQVIVRRGEFYMGLRQPGMARVVVEAMLRIGISFTVVAGIVGLFLGWYFELFAWPALILGADAFMMLSVLWMICGSLAIRQQQWRVAIGFLAGFAAFAALRWAGAGVVMAQLSAAVIVIGVALLQVRAIFADRDGVITPPRVKMPQLSVLAYWSLPYFWYGTVYFAFLFADRVAAATAVAATSAQFSVPEAYNLGMELALLTFLVAASGVEVGGALFGRGFRAAALSPFVGDPGSFRTALQRCYRQALAVTLGTFGATAVVIAAVAPRALPDVGRPEAWATLLAGDLGYAALAVGLLNGLVLLETRRVWAVVHALTEALLINLLSGYVLSHTFGSFHAVDGLLLGAGYFAVTSRMAVRETLERPDYPYALG
jgi:hypothetical protein